MFYFQSKNEAFLSEMNILESDVVNTLHYLKEWTSPEKVNDIFIFTKYAS